jgi:hypothetical protein
MPQILHLAAIQVSVPHTILEVEKAPLASPPTSFFVSSFLLLLKNQADVEASRARHYGVGGAVVVDSTGGTRGRLADGEQVKTRSHETGSHPIAGVFI